MLRTGFATAAAAVALMACAFAPADAHATGRGAIATADTAISVDVSALRLGSVEARQAADALSSVASRAGFSRVIATLGTARPEGELSASARSAQRQAIRDRQARVLTGLGAARTEGRWGGAGLSDVTAFETVPMVAMTVSPEKLRDLMASGEVTQIQEDALVSPDLFDSVPLIEANFVQAQGHNGQGYAVAVLDSGAGLTHPMLQSRIVAEACFNSNFGVIPAIPGPGGSGFIVESQCRGGSGQVVDTAIGPGTGNDCPGTVIGCGHGSHVAATAVGAPGSYFSGTFQQTLNLIGVAPQARLIVVNVFTRFTNGETLAGQTPFCGAGTSPTQSCIRAYSSDIIEGLEFVYQIQTKTQAIYGNLIGYGTLKGVAAANMSLGGGRSFGPCDTDSRKPIIDNLWSVGVATTISAGNSAWADSGGAPGCISTAVTVGSSINPASLTLRRTGVVDTLSTFTNSYSVVDLWAPGDAITAAYPPSAVGYAFLGGTSMAAPHVAGAFAALRSAMDDAGTWGHLNDREKAQVILDALMTRGRPITDPRNGITRARIDVQNAAGFLNPDSALPNDEQTLPLAGSDRARARR